MTAKLTISAGNADTCLNLQGNSLPRTFTGQIPLHLSGWELADQLVQVRARARTHTEAEINPLFEQKDRQLLSLAYETAYTSVSLTTDRRAA